MKTLISGLLLAASVSLAAPVTFNNIGLWSAAGPVSSDVVTFNGYSTAQTPLLSGAGLFNFEFQGVGPISENIYNLLIAHPSYAFFSNYNLGDGTSLASAANPGGIRIVVPAGLYGVGFYFGSPVGGSVTAIINGDVLNPVVLTAPSLPGTAAFFGVRSDVPITSIELTPDSASVRVVIDSIRFSGTAAPPTEQPTEAPEASSAILIGGSLILLPVARKYLARRS